MNHFQVLAWAVRPSTPPSLGRVGLAFLQGSGGPLVNALCLVFSCKPQSIGKIVAYLGF